MRTAKPYPLAAIYEGGTTAMNYAMKCCVIAALAALPVSAIAADAGGFFHVSALRDVHDDNGRAAIGAGFSLPVAALEVRALGEIGAPITNDPELDSRLELTAGWPLQAGPVRATYFGGGDTAAGPRSVPSRGTSTPATWWPEL